MNERRNQLARERYTREAERHRAYARKSYYKHHEENKQKGRERGRERYARDKSGVYARNYKSHCKLRQEVLAHYGDGRLSCVQCGETRLACLTIDHMNGSGADERKNLPKYKRTGVAFYRHLKKIGYPNGYQTLCMNCQWVKRAQNKEWS